MKNILLSITIASLVLLSSVRAQDCMFRTALDLYQQGEYAQAIVQFDAVLADTTSCPDTDRSDVHYWRGWAKFKLGDRAASITDFAAAEASRDNGATARFMKLLLLREQQPSDLTFLRQNISELNTLILHPGLTPSLKDKILLYRNLLRMQIGQMLYQQGDLGTSETFLTGIVSEQEQIRNRSMLQINDNIRTMSFLWLLHEYLLQNRPTSELEGQLEQISLSPDQASDEQRREQLVYLASLVDLYKYLLQEDYAAFNRAKNSMLSLDFDRPFVQDYKATIDLLDKNYANVINANIAGTPFGAYRQGWARFLRHSQGDGDLQQAEQSFASARNALPLCNSELRKVSAFRNRQVRHFRGWGEGDFSSENISQYFNQECLTGPAYEQEKEKWIAIFENTYDYIPGNCLTGQGFIELGLYRSDPDFVERGKNQLIANNCDLVQDPLYKAILLCIGQTPDLETAIAELGGLLNDATEDADEIRYALAMALYNNNQAPAAIPYLTDLANKGSLDACYKLATIYQEQGNQEQACQYLSAIIQRPDVYTIYRADALRLFGLAECNAFGGAAADIPESSTVNLRYADYHVFAYDYIGQGVGIKSKLYSEMKNEIVKFIKPEVSLDYFGLDMLYPEATLTAYINLTITSPLDTEISLDVVYEDQPLPDVQLIKNADQYVYQSGALDVGEYKIVVAQEGSFGWMIDKFIAGSFEQEIQLDSAFVLEKTKSLFEPLPDVSAIVYMDESAALFGPGFVYKNGTKFTLPRNLGTISSAVAAHGAYFALVPEKAQVVRVALQSTDSCEVMPFIRGTRDPATDIPEYENGLVNPLKLLYNPHRDVFYVLQLSGEMYEFNTSGECIGKIEKPAEDSFIIDAVYDEHENCLWLLDSGQSIHQYNLDSGYQKLSPKKLEGDQAVLSLLVDESYFYLVTANAEIQLYKKENFRKLSTFRLAENGDRVAYLHVAVSGKGLQQKSIVAVKRESSENQIWPVDKAELLKSRFDPNFSIAP